ncbi:MAG: hypothetical protein FWH12_02995 [Treponema sp.]|nr:hypothetical protein [Treponema sp.]
MKAAKFLLPLLFLGGLLLYGEPMYSPTWGFRLDLPEGYYFTEGDGRNRFSFEGPSDARFDIVVYHSEGGSPSPYDSLPALVADIQGRLGNAGDAEFFIYRDKEACIIELDFSLGAGSLSGWALAIELPLPPIPLGPLAQSQRPLLLAMAYGPAEIWALQVFHLSALDSLAPEEADRRAPGPITDFTFPRENPLRVPIYGLGLHAWIDADDALASQTLIDREALVLLNYEAEPTWQEAWTRFYRAIYRDSFERLIDIAFQVERHFNVPPLDNRRFAEQVLSWVQSFTYERDQMGSDFLNLVSMAVEGRGDCDPRAMLWALILRQNNINAGIMVSRHLSHAMGLGDLEGPGARFPLQGRTYMVAETTRVVDLGLIAQDHSNIEHWIGILFD